MTSERLDVEFPSAGATCRAWLYRPTGYTEQRRPCIVMAHGLGGTRDAGLEPYARTFADAGHVVLLFDYRHFGASEGEPRQLFSIRRQLGDWASAIAFARGTDGVDPKRIALWGTSFSGGHVVVAAARDGQIAAILAQCPMMDALAASVNFARYAGLATFLKLGLFGMVDQLRAMLHTKPLYIPLIAPPGQLAAMSTHDAVSGYGAIVPPAWRNEICARYALTISGYRPIAYARRVACPALIQVCMRDSLAPPEAALATARKLGAKARLEQYDCGHFDIYVGEHFIRASAKQLAFFNRALRRERNEP
jgi:uncharacterized protein